MERRRSFRKRMKITTGESIWEVKQVLDMRKVGRDECWGMPGDLSWWCLRWVTASSDTAWTNTMSYPTFPDQRCRDLANVP